MIKTLYFAHDYNARGDQKITRLVRKQGWAAYGLYWALIEMLYENGGKMGGDYETLAFDLRADLRLIKSIVEESGLFYRNGSASFGSRSVDRRLQERREQRKRYAEAGRLGAEARLRRCSSDAQAMLKQESRESIEQQKVDEGLEQKQQLTALIASAGPHVV